MSGLLRPIVTGLLLLAMAALSGCFEKAERPPDEGETVKVGQAQYTVVLTRRFNQADEEDSAYLVGQPKLNTGQIYLGVFVRIENKGKRAVRPPRGIEVVNGDGKTYEALDASRSTFALHFNESIPAGESVPALNSPAQAGSVHGSLILYRMPASAIEARPIELEIPAPGDKKARIELDA